MIDRLQTTPSITGEGVVFASLLVAPGTLEETFRAPPTLFYLDNHSCKEIAEIPGVPNGTVMSRISRGKKWLRARLQVTGTKPGNAQDPLPREVPLSAESDPTLRAWFDAEQASDARIAAAQTGIPAPPPASPASSAPGDGSCVRRLATDICRPPPPRTHRPCRAGSRPSHLPPSRSSLR